MQSSAIILLLTVLFYLQTTNAGHLRKNQLPANDDLNKKLFRMRKKFSIAEFHLENDNEDERKYLSTLKFTFNCTNRPMGFYADVEHNCRVFHMCTTDNERVPHKCSDGSAFNQEYRICDWEYNFKCANSEMWYFMNEKMYLDAERQKFEEKEKLYSPEYDIDIK